jgi:hypothetical protein
MRAECLLYTYISITKYVSLPPLPKEAKDKVQSKQTNPRGMQEEQSKEAACSRD